jgi:transcriptional regulator with XRE-family HTH domain
MPDGSDDKPDSLAGRLDLLFRTKHPAGAAEPSYQEVADALAQAGGPKISSAYLYMLRTGRRANPHRELLTALARYFGVPVSYFLDDDQDVEDLTGQLQLLVALRDSGAERLALRAHGLSAGSRQALVAMVEQLRKAEGLADNDQPAPDPRQEAPPPSDQQR